MVLFSSIWSNTFCNFDKHNLQFPLRGKYFSTSLTHYPWGLAPLLRLRHAACLKELVKLFSHTLREHTGKAILPLAMFHIHSPFEEQPSPTPPITML